MCSVAKAFFSSVCALVGSLFDFLQKKDSKTEAYFETDIYQYEEKDYVVLGTASCHHIAASLPPGLTI